MCLKPAKVAEKGNSSCIQLQYKFSSAYDWGQRCGCLNVLRSRSQQQGHMQESNTDVSYTHNGASSIINLSLPGVLRTASRKALGLHMYQCRVNSAKFPLQFNISNMVLALKASPKEAPPTFIHTPEAPRPKQSPCKTLLVLGLGFRVRAVREKLQVMQGH